MKLFGLIGATLLIGVSANTVIAGEVPSGGWQEAFCCTRAPAGNCIHYCDPGGGVRGERPPSKAPSHKAEPKPQNGNGQDNTGK